MELGGGRWSWVEVGARLSNTQKERYLNNCCDNQVQILPLDNCSVKIHPRHVCDMIKTHKH